MPNDQEGAGGLSALAAQYGGLASLAGINIGSGAADKTAIGLEILKSRKFISEFIERHDVLVPLMAARGWDSETYNLKIDPDDYDAASETWVRLSVFKQMGQMCCQVKRVFCSSFSYYAACR